MPKSVTFAAQDSRLTPEERAADFEFQEKIQKEAAEKLENLLINSGSFEEIEEEFNQISSLNLAIKFQEISDSGNAKEIYEQICFHEDFSKILELFAQSEELKSDPHRCLPQDFLQGLLNLTTEFDEIEKTSLVLENFFHEERPRVEEITLGNRLPEATFQRFLATAAENNDVILASFLLRSRFVLPSENILKNHKILLNACKHSDLEILSLLKSHLGAEEFFSTAIDENGNTMAHIAALHNNKKAIPKLKANAPSTLTSVNKFNETPLLLAVRSLDENFVEALLHSGAQLNQPIIDGKTALHLVAEKNEMEAFALLLKKGANISLPDNQGNNAEHYLLEENKQTAESLLSILAREANLPAPPPTTAKSSAESFASKEPSKNQPR